MSDAESFLGNGSTCVALPPATEAPRTVNPSLMAEALIKAEKLREFVRERCDLAGSDEPASIALSLEYNGLLALVAEAAPRLASVLSAEVPVARPGATSGDGRGPVDLGELLFFCEMTRDLLRRHSKAELASALDDGPSLFGPGGIEHDPSLLAAARLKARSLLEFVQDKCTNWGAKEDVSAFALDDYRCLLDLIREAAPKIGPALPPDLAIPAEPKPAPSEDAEVAQARGLWSRITTLFRRDRRPWPPMYCDFLHTCKQIVRLLK